MRLWERICEMRIHETLGEGFVRIHKDLQAFGRGFVRLWERIHARLWQRFVRLWERIHEDS